MQNGTSENIFADNVFERMCGAVRMAEALEDKIKDLGCQQSLIDCSVHLDRTMHKCLVAYHSTQFLQCDKSTEAMLMLKSIRSSINNDLWVIYADPSCEQVRTTIASLRAQLNSIFRISRSSFTNSKAYGIYKGRIPTSSDNGAAILQLSSDELQYI